MINGHRASFLVSWAATGGGPPSVAPAAGARQRNFAALAAGRPEAAARQAASEPALPAGSKDYRPAVSSAARSAIARSVRTVVSMSSVLNWLSSRIRGAAMYSLRL